MNIVLVNWKNSEFFVKIPRTLDRTILMLTTEKKYTFALFSFSWEKWKNFLFISHFAKLNFTFYTTLYMEKICRCERNITLYNKFCRLYSCLHFILYCIRQHITRQQLIIMYLFYYSFQNHLTISP